MPEDKLNLDPVVAEKFAGVKQQIADLDARVTQWQLSHDRAHLDHEKSHDREHTFTADALLKAERGITKAVEIAKDSTDKQFANLGEKMDEQLKGTRAENEKTLLRLTNLESAAQNMQGRLWAMGMVVALLFAVFEIASRFIQ